MVHTDGLWANSIESSIADVIDEHPELFDVFDCVLITSLDSLAELEKDMMVQRMACSHRFLEGGLIVAGKSMRQLRVDGLFSGFDELWCYKQDVSSPKPRETHLVSPLKITTDIPDSVKNWMRRSQCILGLGDGIGLNYVTGDFGIAKIIEANGK